MKNLSKFEAYIVCYIVDYTISTIKNKSDSEYIVKNMKEIFEKILKNSLQNIFFCVII